MRVGRVVIVRFDDGGWAPYFCTDTSAEVQDILEAVAARWAIEEHFHDTKEIWGAGQQQVRNVWSSIGCWHVGRIVLLGHQEIQTLRPQRSSVGQPRPPSLARRP